MNKNESKPEGVNGLPANDRRSRNYEPPAFVVSSLLDLVLTGGSVTVDNRLTNTRQG